MPTTTKISLQITADHLVPFPHNNGCPILRKVEGGVVFPDHNPQLNVSERATPCDPVACRRLPGRNCSMLAFLCLPALHSIRRAGQTPLMRQYFAAKAQHPDALLFFRMGDFYELFYEDAKLAARELEITLTARDRERQVPMCGVPYHAVDGYIGRLLQKGYRIAICEQMEDPKLTKKIVRREVTRVLSPGTALDPAQRSERNNYLAALYTAPAQRGGQSIRRARRSRLARSLHRRVPRHRVPGKIRRCAQRSMNSRASSRPSCSSPQRPPSSPLSPPKRSARPSIPSAPRLASTHGPSAPTTPSRCSSANCRRARSMASASPAITAAAIAAGAALHYVRSTQAGDLSHIDGLRYYERAEHLELDPVSVRNLELVEPLFADASARTTLFHTLDCCQTPMGKRLLRANLLRPLLDAAEIEARLEAVAELHTALQPREDLRRALGGVLDMERLLGRVSLDSAGPRDVLALGASLARLPLVAAAVAPLQASRWQQAHQRLDISKTCTAPSRPRWSPSRP